MNSAIDRYAVFGKPIKHSKSPQIHRLFAKQTQQSLVYSAELAEPGKFEQAVKTFIKHQGKGLNITVPFKQDAWQLADKLSGRAQRAGAVNTLKLMPDGCLYGDTTDGIGLIRDLTQNHKVSLQKKSVLIIGAGGAVRGVIEEILKQQPDSLLIANRTKKKAVQLAKDFSDLGNIKGCALNEISSSSFDIIINGTSASLQGDLPALPGSIFHQRSCSYDMMYASHNTVFMQWSIENNAAQVFDGLGMLVEQAAESFYIWRKVRPETAAVIKHIRNNL